MSKKYFREEDVFGFVWEHANRAGMWDGDASTIAAEFGVSEDEAYEMLGVICDGGHVEKVVPGTYAITEWRERDEPADDLPT